MASWSSEVVVVERKKLHSKLGLDDHPDQIRYQYMVDAQKFLNCCQTEVKIFTTSDRMSDWFQEFLDSENEQGRLVAFGNKYEYTDYDRPAKEFTVSELLKRFIQSNEVQVSIYTPIPVTSNVPSQYGEIYNIYVYQSSVFVCKVPLS